jgi:isoprenylcysteine carboxyl methyltransferase (ICMT) family protein YpbQ
MSAVIALYLLVGAVLGASVLMYFHRHPEEARRAIEIDGLALSVTAFIAWMVFWLPIGILVGIRTIKEERRGK